MAYSLAGRVEAPQLLASVSKARVPVVAVLASVAFGAVRVVLELAFPEMVLGVLLILAAIFTVGFIGEDSRPQLLSTFGLVAVLAVANWLNHRGRDASRPRVESSEGDKQPVLID